MQKKQKLYYKYLKLNTIELLTFYKTYTNYLTSQINI